MGNLTVLFVSPEVSPYASTGGLAEVAEALPQSLVELGVKVFRVMPKFKGIEEKYPLFHRFSFLVETGGKPRETKVYELTEWGVTTYFIGNDDFFERPNVYGYEDDYERFGFFAKAVLEMLMFINLKPDIIHINDWQAALISLYLKEEYSSLSFYKNIKSVFTIHNLQYQGVFSIKTLEVLGLNKKYFSVDALEYYGEICFMKAGIVFSDLVTTVSETYAKEIQTSSYGYGLDGVLRKYEQKITGIVNGMKYDKYDPQTDPLITTHYSIDDFEQGKAANKQELATLFNVPVMKGPAYGIVSRFTEQKGFDIVIYAMDRLCRTTDLQFFILGSGEYYYEHKLIEMSKAYPDKVFVKVGYNQEIAHKIFAGCDYYLMPSLFEPCGLAQMYAMSYGTIPIVRKTGGLSDTVEPIEEQYQVGTGIVFEEYNGDACLNVMLKAQNLYEQKHLMHPIIHNCMRKKFTWDASAMKYLDWYMKLAVTE